MEFSYSKVEGYCAELDKINSDMQKQLEEIKSIINSIDNYWTGEASENYLTKIGKISMNFDDFYNDLKACSSFLLKSSDKYKTLDEKLKNEINDIIGISNIFE